MPMEGRRTVIPDYQTLMAPTLRALAADDAPRRVKEVRRAVADSLDLTDEDRKATISSGALLVHSRINWALTYLAQAALVRRPTRGFAEITDRGREVLSQHPDHVDNKVLEPFPEFQAFRARSQKKGAKGPGQGYAAPTEDAAATPFESIEASVTEANAAVASELLEQIVQREPVFLERLVLTVLTRMGYGARAGVTEHLGAPNDEGLDGVIRQDALGLDRIYVQAKRYAVDNVVGRPQIQAFVGALHGAQSDRGVFITTSHFTKEAVEYAEKVNARVILIDGETLADLMLAHNVGVEDDQTYVVKRIDENFFADS
jgi:restriction system protein